MTTPASSSGKTLDFESENPCSSQGAGTIFPPRDALDILSYDTSECARGFRDYRPELPDPGEERSPSYRWGWVNAKYDRTRKDDGYDHLRFAARKAFWKVK